MSPERPIDITVVLLNNTMPSTSIVPIEIFGAAGVLWQQFHGLAPAPRFRVRTVSLDGQPTRHPVPVGLRSQGALASVRHTDLIIVPAAGPGFDLALRTNAPLLPWLRRWYARGARIAGICTGVSLVAATGILDGKPATTHWAFVDEYRQRFPRVQWQAERFVTESGRLFCGGGMFASIDLSLYLVEKFCGHELAVQTAKALLLETPRIWQSGYGTAPPRSAHDDEGIQKAQAWLFRNFKQEMRVEELATRVGMSPRTFARRFTAATSETPLAYLHRLRIDAARQLLEARSQSVAEVSTSVGYQDLAFFRRLFKRHTGQAPKAYRDRFGPTRMRAA
jgi:transcriptional regulator GlxA family with amidase domain